MARGIQLHAPKDLPLAVVGRLQRGLLLSSGSHWRDQGEARGDEGGGDHSVFAKALLDVLRNNSELMDGLRLYKEVSARVAFAASNMRYEQVPEYAPIKFTGHEGGDFFLVPSR